jgi:hypothetical protein
MVKWAVLGDIWRRGMGFGIGIVVKTMEWIGGVSDAVGKIELVEIIVRLFGRGGCPLEI